MGKSTLFNRLTKTRQAIVNEAAGTTRDRQYGKSEWLGREFSVVDTGGWVVNSDDIFEEEIRKQVLLAVDEADVILFVVDVMNGVTDLDMQVAAILRRANSPVIIVANKTDNHDLQYNAPEFYKLGLGDPYCVSAMTGSGTGDLMDLIVSNFKKESSEILDDDIPRFAVVGRPNAGKSSIVNAFIGEERNIVTEIAGTTRDSLEEYVEVQGIMLKLIDTAGIRDTDDAVESIGVQKSIEIAKGSDIILFVTEAGRDLNDYEKSLIDKFDKNNPIMLVINKSDKARDSRKGAHISAKNRQGLEELKNSIVDLFVDKSVDTSGNIITNQRHAQAVKAALESVKNALLSFDTMPLECSLVDLKDAYFVLGEITGSTANEDIINNIFERFCLGK